MTPERRKRIDRLKKIILRMIVLMVVLPTICSILFGVKLYQAGKSSDRMAIQILLLEKALQDSNDAIERERALVEMNGDIRRSAETEQALEAADTPEESAENPESSEGVRKVYLTFDDGPSAYTEELLDILAKYGVKASFFVTGKGKGRYGDVYRRIIEEGHTLGLHSYSHEYNNIYSSLESFQNDLLTLQTFLYNETGVISSFYRFPGGSSNTISQSGTREMAAYLKAMGITYFDWNVSAGDADGGHLSSEQIINNVMLQLPSRRVAIVLMHDAAGKYSTVEALPGLIEKIQQMENTEILPISNDTVPIRQVEYE